MPFAIVYLHGFLSSPLQGKGEETGRVAREMGLDFWAPDINLPPDETAKLLTGWTAGRCPGEYAVIGASLGGFWAAWLTSRTGAVSVLLNPAVTPWRVIDRYLGEQRTRAGGMLKVEARFASKLQSLAGEINPAATNRLLVLTQGDELLDPRDARAFFTGAASWIFPGGDHAMTDYKTISRAVLAAARSGIFSEAPQGAALA